MGRGLFAFEEAGSLLNQAEKILRADLHLVRCDNSFIYSGHQQFVPGFFAQRAFIGLEKAPLSSDGFDDAQALQLGISLGDGIAIDAQFLGQRSNGRERVAMPQSAGRGGITDLIDQLEINRFARLEIDTKDHALTVIEHYDRCEKACQWGFCFFLILILLLLLISLTRMD